MKFKKLSEVKKKSNDNNKNTFKSEKQNKNLNFLRTFTLFKKKIIVIKLTRVKLLIAKFSFKFCILNMSKS